jgi:PAS domain S-box-containing protein
MNPSQREDAIIMKDTMRQKSVSPRGNKPASLLNKFYSVCLFLILIPMLAVSQQNELRVNTVALDNDYTKNIMILNSYHQGHPWTDGVTKGILDKFSEYDVNVEFHIENMDSKRILNKASWENFVRQRLDAYPRNYLDMIIVSDDNALQALYEIGHQYHNVPVVYCGISEDISRHTDTCSMFIGIEEHLPFKENIELGLKIFPKTEHIAIVTDASITGATHYYTAKQALKNMNLENYDIIWINGYKGLNTAAFKDSLAHLPENTFVIFSIWQVDGDSRFWDPLKYYPQFAEISNAPMFTVTDIGIKEGILGGMVTVSETQGHLVAETAIQILFGELLENVTRVSDQNAFIFNWDQLNKWNISPRDLPENSQILNKPLTVYSQYRTFFYLTLSLIILLFILFWLLLLYHFRYRNYEIQRTEMANQTKTLANRYKILFEESNNAIVIFELESGIVRSFNNRAIDMFGTPTDRFQDYPLKEYLKEYDIKREGIESLLTAPFELELFRWDRSTFQAQIILSLLEEDNTKLIYAVISDITLKKEQENEIRVSKERLNEALLNSKNSYWEWNLENNVLNKDNSFWLALSIDPTSLEKDPLDAEYYINGIHPEDKQGFLEEVKKVVDGKIDTILHEMRMVFKGKETWVEIRAVISKRDEKGKGLVISGFMMNISERKAQELELLKAKVRAEESDELKSAFISNISHEIRTPLNGIVGFSNLLGRENLSLEDKRKYLSFINENNDLLLKLINDILELSKIETDSLTIKTETCNLMTLCEGILAQERISLSPTVTLSLSEVQSVNVQVDKANLTQILRNLLSNAKKFTPEGRIELGFRIDRDKLEFYVRDTGIGIDPSMHEHVFERFTQIDPFATGTGLGLSISKAVVEKMGGNIWLDSSLGKGTTVYFTIKYKKANISIAQIEPDVLKEKIKQEDIKSKTVLIVEDDESSFVLLNVVLIGKYKVIRAVSHDEVIPYIKKYDPDLLLVDMYMPGFTPETINSIREISNSIPIIGISDNTLDFIRNKEIASDLDEHISKPINIKHLIEILETKLG